MNTVVKFTANIERFKEKGEKSGWTFITVPRAIAEQLSPGIKKSFRVKGKLDNLPIEQVALLPMGDGSFILPLNQTMRRKGGFVAGNKLAATIQLDKEVKPFNALLLACLEDAPVAKKKFDTLPPSHQRYYSNWIESAKTDATQMKRAAQCVMGLERGLDFGASTKLEV